MAVARFEGSDAYKTFMRREIAPDPSHTTTPLANSTWCAAYKSVMLATAQDFLGLCPTLPGDADVVAAEQMLAALRNAAEHRLGHRICFANISLRNLDAAEGYTARIIKKALSNIGMRRAYRPFASNSVAALVENGLGDDNHDYYYSWAPSLVTLEVDTGESDLNFNLEFFEDGVRETIRSLHNILSLPRKPHDGNGHLSERRGLTRREAIHEALTDITKLPFDRDPQYVPAGSEITELVIHGNFTHDPDLKGELIDMFGAEMVQRGIRSNPEYNAAQGAAKMAFWAVNDDTRYEGVDECCCWRSWGRGCPTFRQRVEF